MPDLPVPESDKHLRYLDSARGIAALMVFAMHFLDRLFNGKPFLHYLYFVFNGKDAVSFFFVLSGFVLSYKYIVLKKPLDVKRFYVTRIFRLFPPFFIILLLNVLFNYRNDMTAHTMADIFIYNKIEFWEEAVLFKFHNIFYYPGWTLSMELIVSFLMPFFIALAIKDKRFVIYMLAAFLIQGGNFNFHFLLGIILSCNYYKIIDPSFRITWWYRYRYLILVCAISLFSIRIIDMVSPFGPTFKYLMAYLGMDFFFFTGFAAFLFIGGIMISRNAQRLLQTRLLVFLGKISYSIYLVHTLMMSILFNYLPVLLPGRPQRVMIPTMMVCYLALTILSATIMHYYVELPFMRMGRRIAARLKPSIVVESRES